MLSRDGERVIEVVLLAAIVALAIGSRAGRGPSAHRDAAHAPSAPAAFRTAAEEAGDGAQGAVIDAHAGRVRTCPRIGPAHRLAFQIGHSSGTRTRMAASVIRFRPAPKRT